MFAAAGLFLVGIVSVGAQQCCDVKNVTDHKTDASMNGVYTLKNKTDTLPNPMCKDGCIYTKDNEDYCFMNIELAKAPSVGCEKLTLDELNKTVEAADKVTDEIDNIKKQIEAAANGRMQRSVAAAADCDQVAAYTTKLFELVDASKFVEALTYTQPIKDGLNAFNGCKAQAQAMVATLEKAKETVEVKVQVFKVQLKAAIIEIEEAAKKDHCQAYLNDLNATTHPQLNQQCVHQEAKQPPDQVLSAFAATC